VSTADGFFKAAIRRHAEVACWSWALEWNMKYRIVGFFGDRATAETIIFGLPKPEVKSISEGSNFFVRYHVEMPLSENEDKLFYYDLPSTDDRHEK